MIGFAVIVGFFVSRPSSYPPLQIGLGFLTGFLVCAYSMVVNDVYDLEVDRVNAPERPLPSGKVGVKTASRLSVVVLAGGLAASGLSLNPIAVGIAGLYALLSWTYNAKAKKIGLPGNLIVASSLAIPFIYGGVVAGVGTSPLLGLMALTAFLSGVGREVVKAMSDVEGDAKREVGSVARKSGLGAASKVGAAFFVVAVFTSWVPLVSGLANWVYTAGVIVPDVIFVYLALAILRKPTPENAHRVKTIALAGMTAGLLVFIGGAS